MKNGAKSSNLENSIIYVGKDGGSEIKCAQVGPNMPQNQWVTFTCEDETATAQQNVFGTDQDSGFDGISGTYVRI